MQTVLTQWQQALYIKIGCHAWRLDQCFQVSANNKQKKEMYEAAKDCLLFDWNRLTSLIEKKNDSTVWLRSVAHFYTAILFPDLLKWSKGRNPVTIIGNDSSTNTLNDQTVFFSFHFVFKLVAVVLWKERITRITQLRQKEKRGKKLMSLSRAISQLSKIAQNPDVWLLLTAMQTFLPCYICFAPSLMRGLWYLCWRPS